MKLRMLILILMAVLYAPEIRAQKKSRKQAKQMRKLEQYQAQKQALRDTSFFYKTSKILAPYIANNWSVGYLSIKGNTLRVQELDWIATPNKRTRWREQTTLNNYEIQADQNSEKTVVRFDCRLKGLPYFFTIVHGWEMNSELVIRDRQGREVKYSGKVEK